MTDSAALERLVGFGRDLRGRGLAVGTGRILTYCRAAAALSPLDRRSLYWAGRASLVSRADDIGSYDEAFDEWWGGPEPESEETELVIDLDLPAAGDAELLEGFRFEPAEVATLRGIPEAEDQAGPTTRDDDARLDASAAELLRKKTFDVLTSEERERVDRLIHRLEIVTPIRTARRTRPARSGRTFDMRRTLRRSLRTEGEPFDRAWRARRTRERPLVVLLDISGSMSMYSRQLVQFAFVAMAAGRSVEVFCFGTRLTRVTRSLRTHDPDRAMHEIADAVGDWEGGTRIGASLKAFLDGWSQRSALRGAVVVMCSDGLERGDPDQLAAQMARLHRLAHRIVWVNPLKGSNTYQPLARGMAAALPSVDTFLAGHNFNALEELAAALSG